MKNSPRFGFRAACAALGLATATATVFAAEDIDIFAAGAGTVPKPNLMILLDNSSNWSATLGPNDCFDPKTDTTKFHAEICALQKVVPTLNEKVRLGLMMFTEGGASGAYVRAGIRDMNDQNKTAFTKLVSEIKQLGAGSDNAGSSQPYGKAMFEAFKYFGGYTNQANAQTDLPASPVSNTGFGPAAFAGWGTDSGSDTGAARRDHGVNNAAANRAMRYYGADNIYAFDNSSDREYNYNNAILDACAKNFLIVISNGNPSPLGGDSSGTSINSIVSTLGVTPSAIMGGGVEVHSSKFDEMARFLYTTDVSPRVGQQKVITYTIAVYQPQKVTLDANGNVIDEVVLNTDREMIKLMKSAASAGGGKYFAARNAQDVINAILKILNEVQAVNSVFVSASLPVSVNTQGTFLNQVYMGMFRPDGTGNPRWMGNLKQYKFVLDPDTSFLYLADSNNNRAVNPATGFISPAADSFWTHASTYWALNPSGSPLSGSDKPDGEIVEKGGAAQSVRQEFAISQDSRRMYTCPSTGCTAGALSYEFSESNISGGAYQAALSPNPAAPIAAGELLSLVRWIRGEDNVNADPRTTLPENWTSAEGGPGLPVTVRPSAHGDVLHSRPVVLNFGALGPYVFYGANDGTLRAVKGGQATGDGHEVWSFVAPEFYGKFKRLRDASPQLLTPSTIPGITPPPTPKDYFFDGPIGSFQDATRAWIFVSARRGGRVLYAFDVTDPTSPKFMWKKTGTDLPNLGQTWSEPKSIKVKASADPLLIFGAGYDPGEDQIPPVNNGVGRGIYVLNARTGAELRFLQSSSNGGGVLHSIPSDVAVADVDGDTFADRAYVGDTGGNVWRLDIDALSVGDWKLFKLAALAEAGVSRKFFYQPDIVLSKDFHSVLIGTGDREKPLMTTSSDRFYGLRDFKLGTDATGMVPLTPSDLVVGTTTIDATVKGWYIALEIGEKVVNSPLTIAGVTYFSTNKPQPPALGTCSANLGRARSYGLDFVSGTAGLDRDGNGTKDVNDVYVDLVGGGLPPSPVGGIVQLDDGRLVGFIIGGGESTSPIEAGRIRVDIPKTRQKVYWNTKSDK
ncbi:MAG: PilC/PilY family type IV pilus protein [Lysobacter sp.]|nr:PilC/PilY family type IV pilus protein [Lysobacter sp.]